jgi:hypothetical protein
MLVTKEKLLQKQIVVRLLYKISGCFFFGVVSKGDGIIKQISRFRWDLCEGWLAFDNGIGILKALCSC